MTNLKLSISNHSIETYVQYNISKNSRINWLQIKILLLRNRYHTNHIEKHFIYYKVNSSEACLFSGFAPDSHPIFMKCDTKQNFVRGLDWDLSYFSIFYTTVTMIFKNHENNSSIKWAVEVQTFITRLRFYHRAFVHMILKLINSSVAFLVPSILKALCAFEII